MNSTTPLSPLIDQPDDDFTSSLMHIQTPSSTSPWAGRALRGAAAGIGAIGTATAVAAIIFSRGNWTIVAAESLLLGASVQLLGKGFIPGQYLDIINRLFKSAVLYFTIETISYNLFKMSATGKCLSGCSALSGFAATFGLLWASNLTDDVFKMISFTADDLSYLPVATSSTPPTLSFVERQWQALKAGCANHPILVETITSVAAATLGASLLILNATPLKGPLTGVFVQAGLALVTYAPAAPALRLINNYSAFDPTRDTCLKVATRRSMTFINIIKGSAIGILSAIRYPIGYLFLGFFAAAEKVFNQEGLVNRTHPFPRWARIAWATFCFLGVNSSWIYFLIQKATNSHWNSVFVTAIFLVLFNLFYGIRCWLDRQLSQANKSWQTDILRYFLIDREFLLALAYIYILEKKDSLGDQSFENISPYSLNFAIAVVFYALYGMNFANLVKGWSSEYTQLGSITSAWVMYSLSRKMVQILLFKTM